MAPSSGHLLVPKAIRFVKFALSKTKTLIRSTFESANTTATTHNLHPIPIPIRSSHPIHPQALLRHSRSFTTFPRRPTSLPTPSPLPKPTRSSLPSSFTARRAGTPFASPLRPNLTSGTLPRTTSGPSLGGVHNFSHTPVAPAQVVQNVSAAVRAFCLQGGKARFDGVDVRNGEKRYRSVSVLQERTARTMREMAAEKRSAGARVEWAVCPTITALTSLPPTALGASRVPAQTLGADGLLDLLASDFARAVKDLAAVLADLKRLALLGDLPLAVVGHEGDNRGMRVAVHFAGCDGESVERLCADVGVRRGVVRTDSGVEEGREAEMALLFPFAPGVGVGDGVEVDGYFDHTPRPDRVEWRAMMSPTDDDASLTSREMSDHERTGAVEAVDVQQPWIASSPSGFSSLRDSDFADDDDLFVRANDDARAQGYDGLEGIYRFLRECDGARR